MLKLMVKLIDSIVWPLVIVTSIWMTFFVDRVYGLGLNAFGMHPKSVYGILGIFTMPFLHSDFDHLFSNSIPLLLSMGFIFIYFKKEKWHILLYNLLMTGAILLIIGKPYSNHIGASGLVYAYIFFLITHAFFTRNKEMLAAAFILIFLYGSLIYGIFPEYGRIIGKNISWEGHLAGTISGIFWGLYFRNSGPQLQVVQFDDEENDEFPYWEIEEQTKPNTEINYIYKKKDESI